METNYEDSMINSMIASKQSQLTKTEKRVASYIIENKDKIIYESINDLAETTNSSDASIVRMCRKLGFKGFQELKICIAKDTVTPLSKILDGIKPEDSPEQILSKCFSSAIETLNSTLHTIDPYEFVVAANVIMNAHRVLVFGLGSSASVAVDIAHKFLRLGLESYSYSDNHYQMIACCTLTKNDVVIGISHSGSSRDVVEALEFAKKSGATTICITNHGKSPITKNNVSDIKLFTSSTETKYKVVGLSSRLAQLTIVDALYAYISLKKGKSAIENFEKVDEALSIKKY